MPESPDPTFRLTLRILHLLRPLAFIHSLLGFSLKSFPISRSPKMAVLLPLVAGAVGVATHLLFFKRGEHHLYPTRYLQAMTLTFGILAVALTHYGGRSMKESLYLSSSIFGYFLAGLYASLITYRLFFNPLNKLPGPYFARLSKWDLVFRLSKFDANKHFFRLHQKYGKFVRIGPNDMSITEPEGMQVINGATSKCKKSPW